MTITNRPQWSLGRGNAVVPSRWQATTRYAAFPVLLISSLLSGLWGSIVRYSRHGQEGS